MPVITCNDCEPAKISCANNKQSGRMEGIDSPGRTGCGVMGEVVCGFGFSFGLVVGLDNKKIELKLQLSNCPAG